MGIAKAGDVVSTSGKILRLSQAQHHRYPNQNFPNTFAEQILPSKPLRLYFESSYYYCRAVIGPAELRRIVSSE
jgi:hypothetical protein